MDGDRGFSLPKRRRSSDEKKRLLCATTVSVTADLFLRGQLAFLRESGWDVLLVSSPGETLDRVGSREGVETVGLPMERELAPIKDMCSLARWIALLLRRRPDVVSVGTPKAALLGVLAGFLVRVSRRVYVVRGLRYEGATGHKRRVLMAIEWLTCALATDVVVVSPSVGEMLKKDRLCTKAMLLVGAGSSNGAVSRPKGFDLQGERERVRNRLNIESNEFVIGFVGRPNKDKGGDILYEASERLREQGVDHTIVIVGADGQQSGRPTISAQTISIGWVADAQALMCAFDVLALPTMREGFPNVILEAGAVGVPSVTTRATGARDSVIDGKTGLLVDVGDAEGLAGRLKQIAASPELRDALGRAARVRVEEEFAPERIWSGLDAIYSGRVDSCPWITTA
jgi:glycosyltransferase involved in cell wall biosynthesis